MDSLSIILLNHNTYELTCNCLRSIYRSNIDDIDLEVILVDNGSSEEYDVHFRDLFPDIIYLRTETNLGFAGGNNAGLRHATKTYVLLLNSDTIIVDPDTFHKTISAVQEFQNRVVLTTQLLTAGGQAQTAYGPLPGLFNELLLTSFVYKLFSEKKRAERLITFLPDENRLIREGYITATYFLFARDLLHLLPEGKLNDRTFLYGEELFWATDWLAHGIRMYYFPEVAIIHLIGQSTRKMKDYNFSTRRRYQVEAEHHYLLWRFGALTVVSIYVLRIIRFLILSPFDKDIRVRLLLLLRVIFKTKKNGLR